MERILTIDYRCTFDDSLQKAKCFVAQGGEKRPLLVGLHTWSGNYEQDCTSYATYCLEHNWNFIYPDFRGPNWTKIACGSDAVVSDIADAVAYMKRAALVDEDRVYLIGGSGGGHASLLMAGRHPELWTAVSSWCPISDVAAWHDECILNGHGYDKHIRLACGGDPSKDEAVKADALYRSPVTYMSGASRCLVDIYTGIHDGHIGSVPVSQALNAFNLLASPEERISEADVKFITQNEQIPEHLEKPQADPAFGTDHPVLFRRRSNLARVTVFEGGHDCVAAAALDWLSRQNRRNAPDWREGTVAGSCAGELAK